MKRTTVQWSLTAARAEPCSRGPVPEGLFRLGVVTCTALLISAVLR